MRLLATAVLPVILTSSFAYSSTLVEDFSTINHWDAAASTGTWNLADHVAQGAIVANGDPNRPITVGDGSDGALASSSGYTFDTNAHPNGFNFTSVRITGGAITVTGTKPLVIRSLSTVNITPSISVNGTNGANGASDTTVTATVGGIAVTSSANGGAGGAENAAGGDGIQYNGNTEAGTEQGVGSDPINSTTGPGAPTTFDTTGQFIAGTSGAGGGGALSAPDYATGGAGGAGGGTVHIVALGDLTTGIISAKGGDGGTGGRAGGACAGNGAGGNGGAIWLQTLHTLTKGAVTITGGNGPSNGCNLGFVIGVDGTSRGDAVTGAFNGFSTANAAPSTQYTIQSKAYDLGISNALFTTDPTVTSTASGGTIAITYAGSTDGTTYSGFTSKLTDLSNQNYRYLKFHIMLTTAASAGPSPTVSKISIDYSAPAAPVPPPPPVPPSQADLHFTPGCGTLVRQDRGNSSDWTGPASLMSWFALLIALRQLVRTERREEV